MVECIRTLVFCVAIKDGSHMLRDNFWSRSTGIDGLPTKMSPLPSVRNMGSTHRPVDFPDESTVGGNTL